MQSDRQRGVAGTKTPARKRGRPPLPLDLRALNWIRLSPPFELRTFQRNFGKDLPTSAAVRAYLRELERAGIVERREGAPRRGQAVNVSWQLSSKAILQPANLFSQFLTRKMRHLSV